MPQLPSGRRVGLSKDWLVADLPTNEALQVALAFELDDATKGQLRKLYPVIDVIYYRDYKDPPEEPYLSGFTLETIESELAHWSQEDRAAWFDFLSSERAIVWLEEVRKEVGDTLAAILKADVKSIAGQED